LLAAAVAAVVALGVGGFVAVAGPSGDGGVTLPAVQPFSLAAAAQDTISARSVAFDLTVTAGDQGTVSVSGAVDNESEVMTASTDLSGLLGLGDSNMPADLLGDGTIEVLYDSANTTIYLDAGAIAPLLPAGTTWISVDLSRFADQAAGSIDGMLVDPSATAQALLDSGNVVEVGHDAIDGVDTVHYQVTVDVATALAASPQAGSKLSESGVDLPGTVTYDVWVTADNQLRRASFDVTVAGQDVSMVLNMTPSDQPLDVQVPTDAFDITGLLGG
jgi:hypothetical protein